MEKTLTCSEGRLICTDKYLNAIETGYFSFPLNKNTVINIHKCSDSNLNIVIGYGVERNYAVFSLKIDKQKEKEIMKAILEELNSAIENEFIVDMDALLAKYEQKEV